MTDNIKKSVEEEKTTEAIAALIFNSANNLIKKIFEIYPKSELDSLNPNFDQEDRLLISETEAILFLLSVIENQIFSLLKKEKLSEDKINTFISLIRNKISSSLIKKYSPTLSENEIKNNYHDFCIAYIKRFKEYQKYPFLSDDDKKIKETSVTKFLELILPETKSICFFSCLLVVQTEVISLFELIKKECQYFVEVDNNTSKNLSYDEEEPKIGNPKTEKQLSKPNEQNEKEIKEKLNEDNITQLMEKMRLLNNWIMLGGAISLCNFVISYTNEFIEYQAKGQIFLLSVIYILFIIPLILILINGLSIKKNEYKINVSTYLSIKKIMIVAGIMAIIQFFFNLIQGGLMIIIFLDAWSIFKKINKLKEKI